ncbi:ECF transporter S component [Amnibacterium flavum]|uniref:Uncharacterized protein n=1 Tax=Amnibacterium flavum TaxID=2173173 RepID=A0A2V1HW24_9MICO|nr:ECF transporter S component [Amnibacterium flavum]PVZ95280.1 hypothetical protein DDQ50_01780 [Amnibacterium flavum]
MTSHAVPPTRRRASTRFLMTCAVLGVAGGLLSIALNWASVGFATVGVVFFGVTIGLWVLPSIIGLALLQRPGAGALIAVLAGLVNAPFTPFGYAQIPTALMMAVLVELPFLVTLYRVWKPWLFYVGYTVLLTAFSTLWFVATDIMSSPALLVAAYAASAIASLFFVWLALLLAKRLRHAGVGRTVARPVPPVAASPYGSGGATS